VQRGPFFFFIDFSESPHTKRSKVEAVDSEIRN